MKDLFFHNPFVVLFIRLSPFIVVSMVAGLLIATWHPAALAKHREGGMSIVWTRAIIGTTLMLVLTLIVVLPRL